MMGILAAPGGDQDLPTAETLGSLGRAGSTEVPGWPPMSSQGSG